MKKISLLIVIATSLMLSAWHAPAYAFMPGADWWYATQFTFVPQKPLPAGVMFVDGTRVAHDVRWEDPSAETYLVNETDNDVIVSVVSHNTDLSTYGYASALGIAASSPDPGKKHIPLMKLGRHDFATPWFESGRVSWQGCGSICEEMYDQSRAMHIYTWLDQFAIDETGNTDNYGNIDKDDRPADVAIPLPVTFILYLHHRNIVYPVRSTITYTLNSAYDPHALQKGLERLDGQSQNQALENTIRSYTATWGFDPLLVPLSRTILSIVVWKVSLLQSGLLCVGMCLIGIGWWYRKRKKRL